MTLLELIPIAWPLVTAAASFVAHVIERRYPRAAQLLRATGLDVPGAMRALRPSAPRPALPDVPDDGPMLAGPKPKRKKAPAVKR